MRPERSGTDTVLHEPTGTLLGPVAIVRDVTARWEQERALKKRLAALEAKVPPTTQREG
jgi:hypothetical protein